MVRAAAALSILVLAICAGCGGSKTDGAATSVAAGCSDSAYTEAVSPRLVDLTKAVIQVDAGHGDINLLDASAPGLGRRPAWRWQTAKSSVPCKPGLVQADRKLLAATRRLSSAGHELSQLTTAAKKGKDYSGFQSLFLASYYAGTDGLQVALAALRSAGAPPLVKATDGKAVFIEAGCSTCHTLAAAGAKGTVGPNLDDLKPPKPSVVSAVTNGKGVMLSFRGMLTADQIQAVSEFVGQSAGA